MTRKDDGLHDAIDQATYAAMKAGKVTIPALVKALEPVVKTLSTRELLEVVCHLYLSESKQRLRSQGLLEVTKGNDVVLVKDLSADDVEFIDGRRVTEIAGRLWSRAVFNHENGRPEEAEESLQALRKLAGFESYSLRALTTELAAEPTE